MKMAVIEHSVGLLVLLGIVVTVGYAFYKNINLGKSPNIRPIAAIEGIEDLVGRAAESGMGLHVGVTGTSLQRDTHAGPLLCGIIIAEHVAHLTAQAGVHSIFSCQSDNVVPMLTGVVKDAYTAEGKEDLYDDTMIEMGMSESAYSAWYASMLARERITSTILVGWLARSTMVWAEEGRIANCLQIGGTTFLNNMCFAAVAFDYSLLGDEMYAAAAAISKDPRRLGAMEGMDIIKWWTIGLLLIIILGAAAGLPVLEILTG